MYSNIGSDLRVSATAASLLSTLPEIVLAVAVHAVRNALRLPVAQEAGAAGRGRARRLQHHRLPLLTALLGRHRLQVADAQIDAFGIAVFALIVGCVAVCFSFMRLWQLILMTIGPRRRLRRLCG
ncbi:MAG: hypothetical protein IKS62_04195 [Aeriscardovia sp.]|nr:hypothetical protein [Aeriscardovia sp.]MBR6434779.1 hypothetical protein [Aeriscardovia sp.]